MSCDGTPEGEEPEGSHRARIAYSEETSSAQSNGRTGSAAVITVLMKTVKMTAQSLPKWQCRRDNGVNEDCQNDSTVTAEMAVPP